MKLEPRLAVTVAFLYSLGYPIGALGVEAMAPGPLLVGRFVLSGLALAVIAVVTGARRPRGVQLRDAVVVGLLTQAVQFIGCYEAMRLGVSPVLVALVIAMNPLATAVLAAALLGERISRRRAVALVLAVVAVVVAFAGRVADVGIDAAVLAPVVALVGLSLGGVLQQRRLAGVDAVPVSAIGVTASVPFAVLFSLFGPVEVYDARQAVLSLLAMVVFSSVLGMTLYLQAVRRAGAAQVSMLFAVIPSGAALLTWALMGTRPDLGVVVGLAIGAVACVLGRERGRSDAAGGDAAVPTAVGTRV
ncbi:DMT family transporter [Luteipulveratus flavus]|uniref:DMT family transporter n=1 Tax=Luteipulveratus flavus TaxID=3031728 RepID=A0ABT6C2G2_9MICO|nr:DMT family transporter [Luteipulveratus sp. YIM 133296]MDF8262985.1 DMT family transporter [Luteipulveratus sp. YIM 133296]